MMKNKPLLLCISLLNILLNIQIVFSQHKSLKLVESFPDPDSQKEENFLAHPFSLCNYQGHYIVTDAKDCCLKIISSEREVVKKIGSEGHGPGEMSAPFYMALDENTGTIFVVDQGNQRISIYNNEGNFIRGIKTSLAVTNITVNGGRVYVSAPSEANGSLYVMYESSGELIKFFGTFFDNKVNKLKFKQTIYSAVEMSFMDDSLYVFYEHLPIINVYDGDGLFQRTIQVDITDGKEIYEHNTNESKIVMDKYRLHFKRWLFGAYAADDTFYAFKPGDKVDTMLIIDRSGKLLDEIPVTRVPGVMNARRFIKKDGEDFIFISIFDAQVQIYHLSKNE
jgi:outer membrane protein assembly factor BamB